MPGRGLDRRTLTIAGFVFVVLIAGAVILGGSDLFGTAGNEGESTQVAQSDRDGDGIADDRDSCPDQGDAGYGLDATGCPNPPPPPPDNDGDGIPNDQDSCPDQGDAGYGLDATGCPNPPPPPPDTDGDGIIDANDACPNQGDAGYGLDATGCPNPPPPPPDTDGDGIIDTNDACPNEGDAGYGLDATGCPNPPPPPPDTDGDGIIDTNDTCPNEGDAGYGLDATGCPNPAPADTDGDGIIDANDTCPNEGDAGYGLDATGCPNPAPADTDGDGIIDTNDTCPNEGDAGYGLDATGCPNPAPADTDGDGIIDTNDTCPDQGDAGYGLDATGCPNPAPADTDGDGVPDDADQCPDVAGLAANDGCPEEVLPLSAVSAAFSANIAADGTVYFTDTSSGTVVSWAWTFGDGSGSNDRNPTHRYASAGTYRVTLHIEAEDGTSSTAEGSLTITESQADPMRCAFEMQLQGDQLPLTVNFVNGSTNTTSYAWTFGDTGTSTDANPSHTYTAIGTYNIVLECTGSLGTLQANGQLTIDESAIQTPLVARFTVNPGRGPAPLTVQFTDTSSGTDIVSWAWTFGDGGNSSDQNPSHAYSAAGTYAVSMTITTGSGQTATANGSIEVIEPLQGPTPSFTVVPQEGDAPLTVTVTDTTAGTITDWQWSFGDGETATGQGPHQHTYSTVGTYTIALAVNGPNGGGNATRQVVVLQPGAIVEAIFSYASTGPFTDSQEFCFTNNSTGTVASVTWTFGDGSSSTDMSPCHTYTAVGQYHVSLSVTGAGGETSTATQVVSVVQGMEAPTAAFSVNRTEALVGDQISLTNQSTGIITSYSWDFGDGSSSTDENPSHTYSAAGSYTISLTVTGPGGSSQAAERTVTISVPGVTCSISGPNSVSFLGTGNFTSSVSGVGTQTKTYRWTLNGTEVGTESSYSNQFTEAGQYNLGFELLLDGTVSCTASKTVTVNNDTLSCDFSGDTSPRLQQAVTYTGNPKNLNGRQIASQTWTIGTEGIGSGANVTYTWPQSGKFTLTYTITLDSGATCTKTKTITVSGSAVECGISGNGSAYLYESKSFTASIGGFEGQTVSYNWTVNGQPFQSGVNKITYQFLQAIKHTIGLEVLVDGTVQCQASKSVTVSGDGLTCSISGNTSPLLNETVAYTGSFSRDFGRQLSFEWRLDDAVVSTSQNYTYKWEDSGAHTLTFIVTPDEGTVCTATKTVNVNEQSLLCTIRGNFSPYAGKSYTYTSTVSGLGSATATYEWRLDGEVVSTGSSLNYTFDEAGTGTLSLIVTGNTDGLRCEVSNSLTIKAAQSIKAIATPEAGIAPLSVAFTAETTNITRSTLVWTYPDGSTHHAESSHFLFETPGDYTIRVTGTGPLGQQEATVLVRVGDSSEIRAAFTPSRWGGIAPMQVCFTDNSQGDEIIEWEWNLGNGETSQDQNPCTTYGEVGTYNVSLMVRNAFGLTASATNQVRTYSVAEGSSSFGVQLKPGGEVCFTSNLSGGFSVESWDFGDGNTSEEANPCHTYTEDGDYTVTLVVKNAELQGAITRRIHVETFTSSELPNLAVSGRCTNNGIAEFVISNSGGGMVNDDTYRIVDSLGQEVATGTFKLAKNGSVTINARGVGQLTLTTTDSNLSQNVTCQLGCQKNNPDRPDCSSLSVGGQCTAAGVAEFSICNTGEPGNGDMLQDSTWEIFQNGNVVQSGPVRLAGGACMTVQWSGGGEVTLKAYQQPGHPGSSVPQDTRNCTPDVCKNLDGIQTEIPAGLMDDGAGNCVTDVCTNLDGIQLEIPAGLMDDGAGNCVTDVCTNLDGIQLEIPAGLMDDGAGNCVTDVCTNLDGIQLEIPAGLMDDGAGNCVTDVCTNLDGIQLEIPAGLMDDGAGNCVTDVCTNLDGIQLEIPAGLMDDGAGNCVTDVCTNLDGIQLEIPAGLMDDGAGNCVTDVCTNLDGIQLEIPAGLMDDGAGNCVTDVCTNLDGIQLEIPAGLMDDGAGNCVTDVCTNLDGIQLEIPAGLMDDGAGNCVTDVCTNLDGIQLEIPAGLMDDGAGNCVTDVCTNLDGIQLEIPAGLMDDGAGNCVTDVCTNLDGIQLEIPAGLMDDGAGNCVTDVCTNLDGIQLEIPAGLMDDGAGNCVTDVCTNLDGIQLEIPAGLMDDGAGNCVTDVCTNLDGIQLEIPAGLMDDGAGNCVTDVCTNLDGIQLEIPAGLMDDGAGNCVTDVCTNLDGIQLEIPAGLMDDGAGNCVTDVCTNLDGIQLEIPAGLMDDGAGNCVTDVCTNLDGIQLEIPAGLMDDGAGNCVTDVCTNLDGIQLEIPAGLMDDGAGNCVTDVCTNLDGIQLEIPAGLMDDGAGNCVTDVCTNLDGIQLEIPAGLMDDGAGNCVTDVCTNLDGIQLEIPAGLMDDGAGNCVTDVCTNLDGIQLEIPAGLMDDGAGNCVTDVCTNLDGIQLEIPAGLMDDGAGNCVTDVCTNLDGIQLEIPAGLMDDGAGNCVTDVCTNLDGIQLEIPAGLMDDGAGNCVEPGEEEDVCPNIDGMQNIVPDGYIVDADGNCVQDVCPNIDGMQDTVPDGYIVDDSGNCAQEVAVSSSCGLTNEGSPNGTGPGFPMIDLNPATCADQSLARGPWTPIQVGAAVCVDWFVYHTNQTGDWEVFRYGELPGRPDADPNLSQGIGNRVYDVAPSRSPDAEWITFASNRDGNWEIYIGAADGSMQQRVTYNTQAIDIDPVWSSAGDRIAYESARDGNWEIYAVDVATGEETRLTDHPANDINPFWSPDGSKLVFQSDRDGLWQIYEMNVATLEVTRLSDGSGDDHDPSYSFDGQQIVFHSFRDGDNAVVYVMNADGTNPTRISDPAGDAAIHVWSSDNSLIAYQSNLDGDLDIYVYELTTGITRLVTDNNIPDYAPTWFCDSPTLIFTSDITEDSNLFQTPALPIDAAPIKVETDATQLTTEPSADQYPENAPSEENASRERALPTREKTQ